MKTYGVTYKGCKIPFVSTTSVTDDFGNEITISLKDMEDTFLRIYYFLR